MYRCFSRLKPRSTSTVTSLPARPTPISSSRSLQSRTGRPSMLTITSPACSLPAAGPPSIGPAIHTGSPGLCSSFICTPRKPYSTSSPRRQHLDDAPHRRVHRHGEAAGVLAAGRVPPAPSSGRSVRRRGSATPRRCNRGSACTSVCSKVANAESGWRAHPVRVPLTGPPRRRRLLTMPKRGAGAAIAEAGGVGVGQERRPTGPCAPCRRRRT